MDEPIVSSRQPIDNLALEKTSEYEKIEDKFDMFREVNSSMMRDALSFAYIEHLIRVSTPVSETLEAIRGFPRLVQAKFTKLLEARDEILQGSVQTLDSMIYKEDLKTLNINLININYRWDGKRFTIEETTNGTGEMLPVCYTLTWKNKYYLLYTHYMSYVDGYDAYSGQVNTPIIPDVIMQAAAKGFYLAPKNKPIVVEEEKKIKKRKITKKDSIKTPVKNTSSLEPMPEVSFNQMAELRVKEMKNLPEELSENEERKGSEESEENEESEESEESEEKPPRPVRKPVEKTWVRYEKKAFDQQKERDQCGPGDCAIY